MPLSDRIKDVRLEADDAQVPTARMEQTSESVSIENEVSDRPITDWRPILAKWNLDPDAWEVVDDTVRSSTWQQSKRLENGERDVVNLFSYAARFRLKDKRAWTDEHLADFLAEARSWDLPPAVDSTRGGTPVAVVVNLADIQGGKGEGGGVVATRQRLHDGLANVLEFIDQQVLLGRRVSEIVLVNNGDPYEGCAGHYDQQLFTVELNHRQQMNFVLDAWLMYAKTLFPLAEKGRFISVLCNHTEMGRMGAKKSQTDDSDSGGAFLAETMKRILDENSRFSHVEWTIPHDEMICYADVAGVPMAFAHGHKIPGNDATGFEKWLNGQVRNDLQAHQAKIWVIAHRHNYQAWDLGSQWGFQCPSLDGGSKWLRDMTGRWSNSGILALTVSEHFAHGWRDSALL